MQRYGPDHWEVLYRENRIPWDAGRVPEGLERYLATEPAASLPRCSIILPKSTPRACGS